MIALSNNLILVLINQPYSHFGPNVQGLSNVPWHIGTLIRVRLRTPLERFIKFDLGQQVWTSTRRMVSAIR